MTVTPIDVPSLSPITADMTSDHIWHMIEDSLTAHVNPSEPHGYAFGPWLIDEEQPSPYGNFLTLALEGKSRQDSGEPIILRAEAIAQPRAGQGWHITLKRYSVIYPWRLEPEQR